MRKLPHWSIPDIHPAFYDTESATAIEMVAKLYATIQELIEEHNKFIGDSNTSDDEFNQEYEKDWEAFKLEIEQKLQNFMDLVELKLKAGDYNTLKNQLDDILNQLANSGLLIILAGEERELIVGADIMPNQTINFKYEASGGYKIKWQREGMIVGTDQKMGVMAEGMIEGSYTVPSNMIKLTVTGLHCILITPVRESILALMEKIDHLELGSGGGSDLPEVTEEDNGKLLAVVGGVWVAKELDIPVYEDGNEVLY
jgi:hypothetical protein